MKKVLVIAIFISLLLPVVISAKSERAIEVQAQKTNASVGKVKEVNQEEIVFKNQGQEMKAEVSTNTKITKEEKQELKLSQVKPTDKVAVVTEEVDGVISTRVFVQEASESATAKRNAIQGLITEINGSTVTLAHQIQRDRTYSIETDESTQVRIKSNLLTGIGSLEVGQRVIAIGTRTNDNSVLIAKRIHVVQGLGLGIFKRQPAPTAIPSVSPTGSPSGEESPTPTGTPEPTVTPSPTPTATNEVSPSPTELPTATP